MADELILDWDEVFGNDSPPRSLDAADAAAALVQSLNDKASVDMPYIASLLDVEVGEVPALLGSSVYFDPAAETWVTSDEYLSGNLKQKLREAGFRAC